MQETDEQAWDRIGARANYRCGCCAALVNAMHDAAAEGGPSAAMAVLRDYHGMVCSSVEWMLWPDFDPDNPGSQAVS